MTELFARHPDLEREILLQARRKALQAERGALSDGLRQGSCPKMCTGNWRLR